MQLWIWRSIRIALPDDWEMLQFSRSRESGRCAFADRYQFRLELSWKEVEGAPDFERMLSDYQAKLASEGNLRNCQSVREGPWQGFAGRVGEQWTSRFGAYLAESRFVVEIVFLWPEDRDAALEREIMQSAGHEGPGREGLVRWKAFGMDLYVSDGVELTECKVDPGLAAMAFSDPSDRLRSERFERRGLVKNWLKSSVSEWLRVQLPERLEDETQETLRSGGHELARIAGIHREKRVKPLPDKKSSIEALAWLCPKDGRLYCFRSNHSAATEASAGADRLFCCERI